MKVIAKPSVAVYPKPLREPEIMSERQKPAVSALMLTDAEELIKWRNPKGWFVQMNMTK